MQKQRIYLIGYYMLTACVFGQTNTLMSKTCFPLCKAFSQTEEGTVKTTKILELGANFDNFLLPEEAANKKSKNMLVLLGTSRFE